MISWYDNLLAAGYLLLWVLTLVWYHIRSRRFDSGSAVIAFYVFYAVVSVFTLNDDIFSSTYMPLRIIPYLYLYAMMMIALAPLIALHRNTEVSSVENPRTRALRMVAVLVVLCGLLQVPSLLRGGMGIFKLFTDISAGKEAYMEKLAEAENVGTGITNIFAIVYNACYDLGVFIFFYFLTLKNHGGKFNIVFLGFLLLGLLISVAGGQRTGIVCGIQCFIVAYLLFKRFMERKITKIINWTGVSLAVIIMLPVLALTVSRFASRGVFRFANWYIGQGSIYFNNYALNPGGTRHGDRTFNMFKRLVAPDTPKNYTERREKYGDLEIDDYYFTTFVGDFAIDFGPYVAVILFVVFYGWMLLETRPRGRTMKLSQLLLVYYAGCVSMQGGMYLFSYSDTGNLKMAVIFLFYAYLTYHDRLLEKFPLGGVSETTETTETTE